MRIACVLKAWGKRGESVGKARVERLDFRLEIGDLKPGNVGKATPKRPTGVGNGFFWMLQAGAGYRGWFSMNGKG